MKLGPGSFTLIMNHHVERDQESLRFSLESDAAYVGVLGPRTRYDKLLAGLAEQGYVPDPSKAARVRSPVGLALGAETPDEVALSIMGELLAIRRGFNGGFLSGSVGSLHRPEETALSQLVVFGVSMSTRSSGGNCTTIVRSLWRSRRDRAPC